MKRRYFFEKLGIATFFGALVTNKSFAMGEKIENCALKKGEIQHMVIFNLSHQKESDDAHQFVQDGTRILTGIPVVKNFQAFNQVSKKNKYQYGFSMVFASQNDYSTYNNHPDHVAFVQNRWIKEVSDFLEIDFEK